MGAIKIQAQDGKPGTGAARPGDKNVASGVGK